MESLMRQRISVAQKKMMTIEAASSGAPAAEGGNP